MESAKMRTKSNFRISSLPYFSEICAIVLVKSSTSRRLHVFLQSGLLQLLTGLFAVVLDEIVYDVLLEAELDGNVLAKNDLAFENILVGEDEVYGRHEILELLLNRKRTERLYWLRVAYELIDGLLRKMTLPGNLKDHFTLNFSKMLVGLGQLNENV